MSAFPETLHSIMYCCVSRAVCMHTKQTTNGAVKHLEEHETSTSGGWRHNNWCQIFRKPTASAPWYHKIKCRASSERSRFSASSSLSFLSTSCLPLPSLPLLLALQPGSLLSELVTLWLLQHAAYMFCSLCSLMHCFHMNGVRACALILQFIVAQYNFWGNVAKS